MTAARRHRNLGVVPFISPPAVSVAALLAFVAAASATPAGAQSQNAVRAAAPAIPAGSAAVQAPVLRAVSFVGVRSVPVAALQTAALRAARGNARGANDTGVIADAVVQEYRRRGFSVAQVIASDVLADGTLRITVAEGVVRRVVLRGNRRTRSGTVFQTLETRPGVVYRDDIAARDRDRLARLGVFEDVTIAPVAPGEADEPLPSPAPGIAPAVTTPSVPTGPAEDTVGLVDILVRVRERRTGNIAAALGYGDRNGLVGYVDVSEDNFAGRAQRVSLQWQRFGRTVLDRDGFLREENARSAYSLSYFAPFVGSLGLALGVDVYDKNTIFQPLFGTNEDSLRNYERRRGATLRVGRALAHGLSVFASARRDQVGYDLVPLDLDPPFAELANADATVGALGLELTTDSRDAFLNASRGYFGALRYENAGSYFGGERDFNRVVLDVRAYAPLARGGNRVGRAAGNGPAVLALRVLAGSVTGRGDDAVPLPEQFFLGGYDLLRGYDLYSIRGDRMVLASAEARVPLGSGVQGALFVDAGNAFAPGARASLSNIKTGVGAGLRFLTPIGPLRLDAAYGDELKTYISLGQAY